jgi:hypothetical protein
MQMSFLSRVFDDLAQEKVVTREEIMDEGLQSIRSCEKEFSNVLSCYDAAKLRDLMQTLQQLENVDCLRNVTSRPGFCDQSKDDQLDAINKAVRQSFEKVFITLYDRGALDRLLVVDETTNEAEEEVVRMRNDVRSYEQDQVERQQEAAAFAAQPVEAIEDPHDLCIREFHELGSAAFKAKYLSNQNNRRVYENCVSQGRI